MKSGKAVGPDDIPVEVWKCLGEAAVEFLTSLFNRVLESERMPEEWRSVLVPIFKNKGHMQSCSNYTGIKLMSHTMKLWERVVEARLRKVVEICEPQYGFMPRKSTTDLEKAYDRVPREELWYCMRKSGVAKKYVRVVQDMYERSRTVVRCAVGQTEEFNVVVGLHQGLALSPFLFAMVMDQLSEEVRQDSPWTMIFADDIVICSESREQLEENLERWRFALERRGMKSAIVPTCLKTTTIIPVLKKTPFNIQHNHPSAPDRAAEPAGINTSLCNWILDFLTGRPQSVQIRNSTSSATTLNTGAPQGCVLSPLLFTLLTHDCATMHSSNHIIKFADDTTVVGLISIQRGGAEANSLV
ncbi:hypothetical protein QTP86_007938 [Hemibagrus guttatus]|nr:hypothetical protein QTP86_007938 [Hemibagrus guttatus]